MAMVNVELETYQAEVDGCTLCQIVGTGAVFF